MKVDDPVTIRISRKSRGKLAKEKRDHNLSNMDQVIKRLFRRKK